jgi:hypothetical protein
MTVTVKHIARLLLVVGAIFVVLYAVNSHKNATPGLTGATRSQFVNGLLELCAKKPAANKRMSAELHAQYCGCVADGMAARLSNDDLKVKATLESMMDAAIAPCAEQARKTMDLSPHSN